MRNKILGPFLLFLFSISVSGSEVNGNGQTYVIATLLPSVDQISRLHIEKQEVHLYPGWRTPLKSIIYQTMVPEVGSNYTRARVRVVPGHQYIGDDDGINARVFLESGADFVSIYFDRSKEEILEIKPTLPITTTTLEVGVNDKFYLKAVLLPESWQHFPKQEVHLYPGWNGTLKEMTVQTMVPEQGSNFKTRLPVKVIPGKHELLFDEGMLTLVHMSDSVQYVTLYLDRSRPEISIKESIDWPESERKTFLSAMIRPYESQKFVEQEVHLYPGWSFPLMHSISQMMIPQLGSNLTAHKVEVYPGYQQVTDDEGMCGIAFFKDNSHGITIYYDISKGEIH